MVRLVVNISNEVDSWLRSQAKRKGDLSLIVDFAVNFYMSNYDDLKQDLMSHEFQNNKFEEVKT